MQFKAASARRGSGAGEGGEAAMPRSNRLDNMHGDTGRGQHYRHHNRDQLQWSWRIGGTTEYAAARQRRVWDHAKSLTFVAF